MSIDWFAVGCVVNGTRIPLTADEQRAVIRRLSPKMRVLRHDEPPEVTVQRVADLLGVSKRQVERIKASLPPAVESVCTVCSQRVWVVEGGIESHPDEFNVECIADEDEWADKVMSFAFRLRAGDTSVWRDLEQLGEAHLRVLLWTALAGFSTDREPFAWIQAPRAVAS